MSNPEDETSLEKAASAVTVIKRPVFDKLVAETMKPPHFTNSETSEDETT